MFTFPSGKTWTHSPQANLSMQKSMASWYTPSPLTTGMHLPSMKKQECQTFVKQMSCAASDHRVLRRLIPCRKSRVAKWVQRFFCLKFFHSIAFDRRRSEKEKYHLKRGTLHIEIIEFYRKLLVLRSEKKMRNKVIFSLRSRHNDIKNKDKTRYENAQRANQCCNMDVTLVILIVFFLSTWFLNGHFLILDIYLWFFIRNHVFCIILSYRTIRISHF